MERTPFWKHLRWVQAGNMFFFFIPVKRTGEITRSFRYNDLDVVLNLACFFSSSHFYSHNFRSQNARIYCIFSQTNHGNCNPHILNGRCIFKKVHFSCCHVSLPRGKFLDAWIWPGPGNAVNVNLSIFHGSETHGMFFWDGETEDEVGKWVGVDGYMASITAVLVGELYLTCPTPGQMNGESPSSKEQTWTCPVACVIQKL